MLLMMMEKWRWIPLSLLLVQKVLLLLEKNLKRKRLPRLGTHVGKVISIP